MAILTVTRRKSSGRRFITSLHGNSRDVHFDEFPHAIRSVRSLGRLCLSLPIFETHYIGRQPNVERETYKVYTFNKEICRKAAVSIAKRLVNILSDKMPARNVTVIRARDSHVAWNDKL